MKKVSNLKYQMYEVVVKYITKNIADFETLPKFNEIFQQFKETLLLINTNNNIQVTSSSGGARIKKKLRNELAEKALQISRKLYAYAILVDNKVLQSEVKFVPTNFTTATDSKLVVISKTIYNKGIGIISNLTNYGLTTIDFDNLNSLIDQFTEAIPKPREDKTNKANITKQLDANFETAKLLLHKIDVLANIIAFDLPQVYSEYKSVRKIVKHGGSTMALKGKIIDTETLQPISSVILLITNKELKVKIRKKSGKLGGFSIQNMHEGEYDVSITKVGYKAKKLTFRIIPRQMCRFNVELEKEKA